MSDAHSAVGDQSHGLRAAEVKTAVTAWALYIAGTCCYCLVYQAVVSAATPDLSRTLSLALREWGGWIALAPLAFSAFRHADARNRGDWQQCAAACCLIGLGAAVVPIVIDQITQTRSFAASVAIFVPRNLLASVVVYLIWRVFLRTQVRLPDPVEEAGSGDRQLPSTLLVSKGADECLIRIEDIQYLSAAGNYVDICARDQRYLMRGRIRQMAEFLPSDRFIRIHRSHIVRVDQVERIKVQRSGNGTVHLRCGATLGISKSYRGQLQRHRPQSFLQ